MGLGRGGGGGGGEGAGGAGGRGDGFLGLVASGFRMAYVYKLSRSKSTGLRCSLRFRSSFDFVVGHLSGDCVDLHAKLSGLKYP